jgi:hypothetical protein
VGGQNAAIERRLPDGEILVLGNIAFRQKALKKAIIYRQQASIATHNAIKRRSRGLAYFSPPKMRPSTHFGIKFGMPGAQRPAHKGI